MWRDQNILITGGSSGIGRELAFRLVAAGAGVALVARDEEKLEKVRQEIVASLPSIGVRVKICPCDATDYEMVKEAVKSATRALGPLDCLICSAGVLSGAYFEDTPVDEFRRMMDTNFFGTLHFVKAVLPRMKGNSRARIVIISSVAGVNGAFGYTSYCASKYALTGLAESLRMELDPQKIKLQLVMPPQVRTPMLDGVEGERPPENVALASMIPTLEVKQAADRILKGIESGKYTIVPDLRTRLTLWVGRMFPGLSRKLTDAVIGKNYQGPKQD